MFTPGPIISGFNIWGTIAFDPLELNVTTTGDGFTFTTVPPKMKTTVGLFSVFTYSLITSPTFLPTVTVDLVNAEKRFGKRGSIILMADDSQQKDLIALLENDHLYIV
ncbi:hypothetical protein H5410_042414 [Solanum commersonii]|uniref:Uncharacterized protein n=1 Tax=Solanum commersonii TaxID=4109 RepID=A0A9J5XXJ8_SOLCO|nr:hypothetical protein H5410_042414 [Solanum commersonii]